MKLVIYAHPFDGTARKVLHRLRKQYEGSNCVYLPALDDVATYLREPSHLDELLVLMPKDRRELDDLVAIGDLMRDTKLVLVLPEDDPGINERSHLMRPRFVTYTDCDPSHLVLVVDRLLEADTTWPMKAVQ